MKKYLGIAFTCSLLTLGITNVNAQGGLINNGSNKNAILDLNPRAGVTNTKGLILPKVQLTSITSAMPLLAHVKGMKVYNIGPGGTGTTAVTEGEYYNDGVRWIRLAEVGGLNEPWFDIATNKGATANTNDIYVMGNTVIGSKNSSTVDGAGTKAKFSVIGQDAFVNGLIIGKGSGQFTDNTVVGWLSFVNNTTGIDNSAFGAASLNHNTTGSSNTAIGRSTLFYTSTGDGNTAVGANALKANISGHHNTAVGESALTISGGTNNTAIGNSAMDTHTTGTGNVAIGYSAGAQQTAGSNNIVIGTGAELDNLGGSYQLNIGNAIYGDNILDPTGQVEIGIGIANPLERLHVNGAIKINHDGYVVTPGATTPVPNGGAGTMLYYSGHFYGWTGAAWKQLDN